MSKSTVQITKPRVVTGFLIFCKENREKAVKSLPENEKTNTNEISKMLCYMWKKLSTEETVKYINTARLYNDTQQHNYNIFHS